MSTANSSKTEPKILDIDKGLAICPYCEKKPQKKHTSKKKDGKYNVHQKCPDGHIWRSMYADG